MKIQQNILDVLKNANIEWNKLFLTGTLDRKTYVQTNEILETIWLNWSRKEKAHIFDWSPEDLKDAFDDVLETWECVTLKETIKKLQYFPTPKNIAEFLIDNAEVEWCETFKVLEPSAGQWAIAKLLNEVHELTCIEIDKNNFDILRDVIKGWKNEFLNMDFLDYSEWSFDRIVMNPPFSKSQDVKHILHAYSLLKNGGILVSIASSSITTRSGDLYDKLRELNPEIIELPQGSFKESWTMVNTVIIKLQK